MPVYLAKLNTIELGLDFHKRISGGKVRSLDAIAKVDKVVDLPGDS